MNEIQKLSVMVWLFKAKADKTGYAPVYAKITIDGEDIDCSLKCKVHIDYWDEKNKLDLEGTEAARITNAKIVNYKKLLESCFNVLRLQYDIVTPQMVKNSFLGKPIMWTAAEEKKKAKVKETILQAADAYLSNLDTLVEKNERVPATRTSWGASRSILAEFIETGLGLSDVPLESIDNQFLHDFADYMTFDRKKKAKLQRVSAKKKITHVKAFLNYSYEKGWLAKNTHALYSFQVKKKRNRKKLQIPEVLKIFGHKFKIRRLEVIRDVFVFQCFTGFAYIDLLNLKNEHIISFHDRPGRWLMKPRNKTDILSAVPLLPIAEQIVEKYREQMKENDSNYLLPICSNQKLNQYLKEIGDACEIALPLTTHLARRTFAHIMLNICNLRLEDVSRMMGHADLKSTLEYVEVDQERLHIAGVTAENFLFSGGEISLEAMRLRLTGS